MLNYIERLIANKLNFLFSRNIQIGNFFYYMFYTQQKDITGMSIKIQPRIQYNTKNKIQRALRTTITGLMMCLSTSLGDSFHKTIPNKIQPVVSETLSHDFIKNLNVIEKINMRGGITKCFDDEALKVLKSLMKKLTRPKTYVFPIDTAVHPYIPATGQFGSPRPQNRPHLGIDIYPVIYGRKPKTPIAVLSATDGIVISIKKSPEYDPKNLIANNIKILGYDGKIYSYDHLGRPEDYKQAKYTPLRQLGTIVQAGDTLGIVGKTGETNVWHLHFSVEDLAEKEKQLANPTWKNLSEKHKSYAEPRGQVNPLDSVKAGEIAKLLNKYRREKGLKVKYIDNL